MKTNLTVLQTLQNFATASLSETKKWLSHQVSCLTSIQLSASAQRIVRLGSIVFVPLATAVSLACYFHSKHVQEVKEEVKPPVEPELKQQAKEETIIPEPQSAPNQEGLHKTLNELYDEYSAWTATGFEEKERKMQDFTNRLAKIEKGWEAVSQDQRKGLPYEFFCRFKEQLEALKPQLDACTSREIRVENNGRVRVRDNGNCFYEALANAWYMQRHETLDAEKLRLEVVRWMVDHKSDQDLQPLVVAAVQSCMEEKKEKIQDFISVLQMDQESITWLQQQQIERTETIKTFQNLGESTASLESELTFVQDKQKKIEEGIEARKKTIEQLEEDLKRLEEKPFDYYCHLALQNGFWAGHPECYAFAKIKGVSVLVRENGKQESECTRFNEGAASQIQVWWMNGNHFENRVETSKLGV